MSGTLALAASLAAMGRDELRAVIALRKPQSVSNISDPIGLASELLRPESVDRALSSLSASALSAILNDETFDPLSHRELVAAGLLGLEEGSLIALDEVRAALRASLERARVSESELLSPFVPEASDAEADRSWYVSALTAVGTAAELLRALRTQPARLNRNGTIAVASIKATAEATGIDPADAARSLGVQLDAGLIVPDAESSVVVWSAAARDWLGLGAAERWTSLAVAAIGSLPSQLGALLRSYELADAIATLPSHYPLSPRHVLAAAEEFGARAAHLGLAVDGVIGEAGRALLETETDTESSVGNGVEAAVAIARRDMPEPVPGVYIQPDLSVVVPGPLAPADEQALAALTTPEQIGIASTRRITEASLAAALEGSPGGEESPRATLERLSLTGIPQPLDYMLASLTARTRSIVVRAHDGDEGRTRVEVATPELLDTLAVDRALHHLQLEASPEGGALVSRLRPEHVLAALGDARYSATAEIAREPERLPLPPRAEPHALPEEFERLVDRVHDSARTESGSGDFTRRLELAIRDRSTVRITAAAQGRTHVFTLLPTSLDAGRLRATDPVAGVERTLPVSTITAVE